MSKLDEVIALIDKVDQALYCVAKAIACVSIFGLIAVTFIDVAGRHFTSAVPGASEIISTILAIGFFAGMPLVIRANGHITVGIAVGKYPGRLKTAETVVTALVSIAAMILITWMMYTKGVKWVDEGSISKFLGFPLAYVAFALSALGLIGIIVNAVEARNISKIPDSKINASFKAGDQK